jgi:sialic acid synthase SpsE
MLHEIGGRPVGPNHRAFVLAEIGLNHSGSVERA